MTDPRIRDNPHSPWQREVYLLRRDRARYFVRLARMGVIRVHDAVVRWVRVRWGR